MRKLLSCVALVLGACEPCGVSPVLESPDPGFYGVDVVAFDDGCSIGSPLEWPFTYVTARGAPLFATSFGSSRVNGAVAEDGSTRAAFELAPRPLDAGDACSAYALVGDGLGSTDRRHIGGCSFHAQQHVELTPTDDGFHLQRRIELQHPMGTCAGPTFAIPQQGCTSRSEETWFLIEPGDPIVACRTDVETITARLTDLELRSPQAEPAALTASPCEASFRLVARGTANDDVCRARLSFHHAHLLAGGGLATGEAPFACDPVVQSSSPLRMSCTSERDDRELWATSAWAVVGLTFRVDERGSSTVTLRFVEPDDGAESSCTSALLVQ